MKYPAAIFCVWLLLPIIPCSAQIKNRPGKPHLPTREEARSRILEYNYPDRKATLDFVNFAYDFLDGEQGWNLKLPRKPQTPPSQGQYFVDLTWAKPCTKDGGPLDFYRGAPAKSVHYITYSRRVNNPGGDRDSWTAYRRTESNPWTVSVGSSQRHVSFTRGNKYDAKETEFAALGFPITGFSFVLEKEGVAHELSFFVDSDAEHLQQWYKQQPEVWASAEQFRDALLAQIDAQEAIIKRDIGKLQNRRDFETVSASWAEKLVVRTDRSSIRNLNYKELPPDPTIQPESPEVLEALRGELERQRELIRGEYQVLYREANLTFPLSRFYQTSKTKSR